MLRVAMQRRAAKVALLSRYESPAPSNPSESTGSTQEEKEEGIVPSAIHRITLLLFHAKG